MLNIACMLILYDQKQYNVLRSSCEFPFLIYEVSQQIFTQLINIKFHGSSSSGSHTDTRGQTGRQWMDGHEANKAIFAANVPEWNCA